MSASRRGTNRNADADHVPGDMGLVQSVRAECVRNEEELWQSDMKTGLLGGSNSLEVFYIEMRLHCDSKLCGP